MAHNHLPHSGHPLLKGLDDPAPASTNLPKDRDRATDSRAPGLPASTSRRAVLALLCLGFLVPIAAWLSLALGAVSLPGGEVAECVLGKCPSPTLETILWKIRIPRTLAVLLGGAALAVSGVLLQALFRNPLAGPGVLGISGGASLTVALFVLGGVSLGLPAREQTWGLVAVAFAGAMLVTGFLLALSQIVRSITGLLIVGLMLGFLLSSVTGILGVLADAARLQVFYVWTMGSFAPVVWSQVHILAVVVPAAVAAALLTSKALDALLMGEEYAQTMGIHYRRSRWTVIGLSSLLAATVVAFAGPVAFVGTVSPILARLVIRSGVHRIAVVASALVGALLTLAADVVARVALRPVELPTGSITAIIGVPVVLAILIGRSGRGPWT
ncbi:MAG: iron ABC transporter permease [Halobacteria archaeon]